MCCSNSKKATVSVVMLVILLASTIGSWMMFGSLHIEDPDDFNADQFMQALGLMMLAVTCWIPIQPTLKEVVRCGKTSTQSLLENTSKMLGYKKEVGQA